MFDRPLSFVVAGAAGAATLTAASAPSPLYPVYRQLWGFSAFTLTVVFAVYVFALLGALLTVGSLSDRVGRRPVACAALVLLALGMLFFAIADGPGGLIAARIVQGLAVGMAAATTTAMIMDWAPNARTGSIVSSAAPPLGIAVGAVLAGALVQYAPLPRQLVFWVLGAVLLTLAALLWWVPESARTDEPSARQSIWRELRPSVGLPPVTRPTFVALLPSMCAIWSLGGLYLSLGSSILGTVLGVQSHFVVGIVLAVYFGAAVAAAVVSAAVSDRLREWVGYGTLGVGILITIAALSLGALPLYVVGSVVAGFGFGTSFRVVLHALGEVSPTAQRGQVFAAAYLASYLAFSVPALVAGLAVGHFGLEPTAVVYGLADVALVLVATSAAVVLARRRRHGGPVSRTWGTERHTTHYLESGPADGPLIVFVHGWPGIGATWRTHLDAFAAEGWHCVAPDLRGFGASTSTHADDAYTVAEAVADLAELHDHLGGEPAIWVGHDWGSVVVGALAAHHPGRCRGAVLTSWAYLPEGTALSTLVPLVDRSHYPVAEYPDGQWDYYRYYTTHFESAVADLDADPGASLAAIYRSGDPAALDAVSPSATVTRRGGRFGAAHAAPATAPDPALWPPADFEALVQAFGDNGFRSSCAWYVNDDANLAYARTAPRDGRLAQPVLFVDGTWDAICTIAGNRQGDPMRSACANLSVTSLPAGHWLPLERGPEHVRVILDWLGAQGLAAAADSVAPETESAGVGPGR